MTAFIVEDGTGLGNATSYVETSFADAYLGADWAPDINAKQESLIAATEYLDTRWGGLLKGIPLLSTQPLEFPRINLVNRYNYKVIGVPRDIQRAVCQYAKMHSSGNLYLDPTKQLDKIKSKSTTVGPVTTSVTYVDGKAEQTGWLEFPLADRLVAQYIDTNTHTKQVTVMRA